MEKLKVCDTCFNHALCIGRITASGALIKMSLPEINTVDMGETDIDYVFDDKELLDVIRNIYQLCAEAQKEINCEYDEATIKSMISTLAGVS